MLKELTVEEFVREVASFSPAPGGGSVAALAAAQGAGLLSMYCHLSQNRDKLGDFVDQLQQTGEEARFLKAKFLDAIDEDTLAFNQVMEAYRLPKLSDTDKVTRREAIQQASINAAEVPLGTARGALKVLALISEVAGKGNPSAVTDLGVANLQAQAGLIGACYNVLINLGMITEETKITELKKEADAVRAEGQRLFDVNLLVIEQGIG
jgi:methenyltetrahydrofolate cyclohydrolase